MKDTRNPIKFFSTDDMIKYLNSFDYIEKKFCIFDDELKEKLQQYEENRQYSKLQKLSPAQIGQTMNRVYGFSNEQRTNGARIFSSVFSKIINEFLNIRGLELLFNEHYYDFEWDMHLEFNVESSQYNYYRDHMEHQVRNMYMMLKLLEEYGLLYEIKKLFNNKTVSKVSSYVYTRHKEFVDSETFIGEKRTLFLNCAYEFYKNILKEYTESTGFKKAFSSKKCVDIYKSFIKFLDSKDLSLPKKNIYDSLEAFFENKENFPENLSKETLVNDLLVWFQKFYDNQDNHEILVKSYLSDYSITYIIYSATIISALFHDVSYPLCFFMNMQKRIGQYLPSMNAFIHNVEADIDRVVSILQPSLLFTLVSEKELRSKLSKNQEKYDHGAFSAVALLLAYYESGRINQISIDKQIAIELAALAIYNHTIKYYITSPDEKDYYRPLFSQNPISFLLRILDDIQEWDRRYFELSKKDETIFCLDCGSPILCYKKHETKKASDILLCKCCGENQKTYKVSSFFPKRNMYTVTTCPNVGLTLYNGNLVFKVNYDMLDLLHMVQISCTYSQFRAKELSKLKVILLNQSYVTQDSLKKFDNIFLDYSISSNPLYLKSKILTDSIILNVNDAKTRFVDLQKSILLQKEKFDKDLNYKYKSFITNFYDELNKSNVYCKSEDSILEFLDSFFDLFKVQFKNDFLKKFKPTRNRILFSLLLKNHTYYMDTIIKDLREFAINCCSCFSINIDTVQNLFKVRQLRFETELKKIIEEKCDDMILFHIIRILCNSQNDKKFLNIVYNDEFKTKISFYSKLSGYILESYLYVDGFLPSKEDFVNIIKEKSIVSDMSKHFYHIIKEFMNDFYDIVNKQTNVYSGSKINYNKYTTQYISNKSIYNLIEQYTCPSNWYDANSESYNTFSSKNLDFHSDLFLFEILGEFLRDKKQ